MLNSANNVFLPIMPLHRYYTRAKSCPHFTARMRCLQASLPLLRFCLFPFGVLVMVSMRCKDQQFYEMQFIEQSLSFNCQSAGLFHLHSRRLVCLCTFHSDERSCLMFKMMFSLPTISSSLFNRMFAEGQKVDFIPSFLSLFSHPITDEN